MCECADGLKGIYQTENYPKTKAPKEKAEREWKVLLVDSQLVQVK